MAAGLGFKDFVTGEVLTAADVDGYLMQGVWVFASAAARDAAVTSPQEGNFAYLKDTNVTTYYTGSAWANLDTTGMTNPMTTTGDTIYSSSGSTPARLGIGSTGQVLTVAGGVPSWATPAGGGGKVLQVLQNTTSTAVANSTTTYAATGLSQAITCSNTSSKVLVLLSLPIFKSEGNSQNAVGIEIKRGGTAILTTPDVVLYTETTLRQYGIYTYALLDSPSSTSSLTYTVNFRNRNASSQVIVCYEASPASLILQEIGA